MHLPVRFASRSELCISLTFLGKFQEIILTLLVFEGIMRRKASSSTFPVGLLSLSQFIANGCSCALSLSLSFFFPVGPFHHLCFSLSSSFFTLVFSVMNTLVSRHQIECIWLFHAPHTTNRCYCMRRKKKKKKKIPSREDHAHRISKVVWLWPKCSGRSVIPREETSFDWLRMLHKSAKR